MGPIALFDKSFLQSLSVDESVWFDQFFLTNVSPMFFVETLADLAKPGRKGENAAAEVRRIADKYPQLGSYPCEYHLDLSIADLCGAEIPSTGQVPIAEGKLVTVDGEFAVKAGESSVASAFMRWSDGEFLAVESLYADRWRQQVARVDLKRFSELFRDAGVRARTCSSLEEARDTARGVIELMTTPSSEILEHLRVPGPLRAGVLQEWRRSQLSLPDFAPYAAFVLTVEAFLGAAMAADHISHQRPSNMVDIAYLYYLPFCMVFVSSDKLHRKAAPLFIREDQSFVWGPDLKAALRQVNEIFLGYPEQQKAEGALHLGHSLPAGAPVLLTELWDRHMPGWRDSEYSKPLDEASVASVAAKISRMERAPEVILNPSSMQLANTSSAYVHRRISSRKGSWLQVPQSTSSPPGYGQ